MRKNQKNTFSIINNIIKTHVFFSTFSATFNRKTTTFQLRKLIDWSFQRYVISLLLKMASEKRFENIIYTTSFINETTAFTCLNYYVIHIKISTPCCHRFRKLKRWRLIVFDRCFFKKNDIQAKLSLIACIIIRRFWNFNRRLISINIINKSLLLFSLIINSLLPRKRDIFSQKITIVMKFIQRSLIHNYFIWFSLAFWHDLTVVS